MSQYLKAHRVMLISIISWIAVRMLILISEHRDVWRVADLNWIARDAPPPPRVQNFFIFMQFSGKIGQIIGCHPPPPGSWRPTPLGNPGSATVDVVWCNELSPSLQQRVKIHLARLPNSLRRTNSYVCCWLEQLAAHSPSRVRLSNCLK